MLNGEQLIVELLSKDCISTEKILKRAIVFGDSEAAHLMAGVRARFSKQGYAINQWTVPGCHAVDTLQNGPRCHEFYAVFMDRVLPEVQPSDVVIVSSRWIQLYNDIGSQAFEHSVSALFDALKKTQAAIFIYGNTPDFTRSPQLIMVMQGIESRGDVFLTSKDFREVNALLKREAEEYGFNFVNPANVFCEGADSLSCQVVKAGTHLFFDGGHLSAEGSVFLVNSDNR